MARPTAMEEESGKAHHPAARRFPRPPAPRSLLEELRERHFQVGNDLLVISDDAKSGVVEDWRILVSVDRDDRFRLGDPDEVMTRSGNADRDVQVRRNRLPGLADLPGRRDPAGI